MFSRVLLLLESALDIQERRMQVALRMPELSLAVRYGTDGDCGKWGFGDFPLHINV
jgi:hypothetical protein